MPTRVISKLDSLSMAVAISVALKDCGGVVKTLIISLAMLSEQFVTIGVV